MRIPGVKTIKRLSRKIRARISGGALILGYHRIVSAQNDGYEICVAPTHFAEHLAVLQKHAHPIGLTELVQCLKQGTLPSRAVAVTFDDGYADNLHTAKPLLAQYQIPATVFISSGYLGKDFWWDELAWLIQSPRTLPNPLRLAIQGEVFRWDPDTSTRNKLINSLHLRLFALDPDTRKEVIDSIREWSTAHPDDVDARRALTTNELVELTEGGLIDIGSHTITHPVLSTLPVEEQRQEISMSRKQLEEILNRPIPGFAYPNGISPAKTREIVRESGFDYACSSESDLVRTNRQIFQLPRFWPKDLDGDKFIKSLRPWMDLS